MEAFKKEPKDCAICGENTTLYYNLSDGVICEKCCNIARQAGVWRKRSLKPLLVPKRYVEQWESDVRRGYSVEEIKDFFVQQENNFEIEKVYHETKRICKKMMSVDEVRRLFFVETSVGSSMMFSLDSISSYHLDVVYESGIEAAPSGKALRGARIMLELNNPYVKFLTIRIEYKKAFFYNTMVSNIKKEAASYLLELQDVLKKDPGELTRTYYSKEKEQ